MYLLHCLKTTVTEAELYIRGIECKVFMEIQVCLWGGYVIHHVPMFQFGRNPNFHYNSHFQDCDCVVTGTHSKPHPALLFH